MGVENHKYNEALEKVPRCIRIFLVRHGKQIEYGDTNSKLSEEGKEQVSQFTQNLTQLFQTEDNKKIVKIVYSSRERTIESARIIEDTLYNAITKGTLSNVRMMNSHVREELQTADPLLKLIEAGIPKQEAFQQWLSLPETTLSNFGSESPNNIGNRFLTLVKRLEHMTHFLGPGPEINYIMVTHETSHAALLRKFDPTMTVKIDYAEPLQIDIGQKDKPTVYKFRGKEFQLT